MDRFKLIVAIIVIIIAITLFFVVFAGLFFDLGYRGQVTGKVSYSTLNDWSCSFTKFETEKEDSLLSLFTWPWDTHEVLVVVDIDDKYQGEIGLPSFNKITGGTESFTVELRHLSEGYYPGSIMVYEVDRGLLGLGDDRKLVAQTTFTVSVPCGC